MGTACRTPTRNAFGWEVECGVPLIQADASSNQRVFAVKRHLYPHVDQESEFLAIGQSFLPTPFAAQPFSISTTKNCFSIIICHKITMRVVRNSETPEPNQKQRQYVVWLKRRALYCSESMKSINRIACKWPQQLSSASAVGLP